HLPSFNDVKNEGEKYHSCRVVFMEEEFEITTYRKDLSYLDHRHPITAKAITLKEDLVRRDFTINALAMNSNYEIIDIFNGMDDLKNKLIRTIGDADIRFNEDSLRVLRAIYYSAKLDFKLDTNIVNAFSKNYVGYLKEEYVKTMLIKIISTNSNRGLEYINKFNVKIFWNFKFN
ncbi:MAG: hypothetical protein IKJ03_00905, partial [Mycoplasmataceae bacterium]|nr:hypothetical protein [Mycoplasmataceae bacterium]